MRRIAALAVAVAVLLPVLAAAEPQAKAEDFDCILNGVKPTGKNFFIFHKNRRKLQRAVAMSESGVIPNRGYPQGTILQLFPFEAMIKRSRRFNPDGNGWEFVKLSITPDGQTQVVQTGRGEVANGFGSCQGCHTQVAPDHDLVCEFVIGAGGLGMTNEQIAAIQAADPRCQ